LPEPDTADLALLVDAAHAAGDIARRHFRQDPETWNKGGADDPVTEADIAIDRMLRHDLLAARPDYGWLSEETEDGADRLARDRVFIVDPIDGTRAFIDGTTAFAHSLAVVERGQPVVGVVYLPMLDKLFVARRGAGATLNGDTLTASDPTALAEADILTTRTNLDARHWTGGVPPVRRSYRPSLAYRLALVGTGRFDGMLSFRDTWEWDIAAGALIAAEAGAVVTDGNGGKLTLNNLLPQVGGIISAGPNLHRALMQHRSGQA